MTDRSLDWLRQAERDLEEAAAARAAGRHERACFAAHQSAEQAVQALHSRIGQEAWGHVVAQLLTELPSSVSVPVGLIHQARALDNFYIPTRYPNAHPSGAPFKRYRPLQSETGIRSAGAILAFVRAALAGP